MLTLPELFHLYQLPLELDTGLHILSPDTWLPFKDSPPPDLYVSIFRQMWSVEGGFWEDKKGILDDKKVVKGEEVGREESVESRKEVQVKVDKELPVECRKEVHVKVDKVLQCLETTLSAVLESSSKPLADQSRLLTPALDPV